MQLRGSEHEQAYLATSYFYNNWSVVGKSNLHLMAVPRGTLDTTLSGRGWKTGFRGAMLDIYKEEIDFNLFPTSSYLITLFSPCWTSTKGKKKKAYSLRSS